jgi:hypothetical protein
MRVRAQRFPIIVPTPKVRKNAPHSKYNKAMRRIWCPPARAGLLLGTNIIKTPIRAQRRVMAISTKPIKIAPTLLGFLLRALIIFSSDNPSPRQLLVLKLRTGY